MDRPGDLVQWNIFKIMTACCQIILQPKIYFPSSGDLVQWNILPSPVLLLHLIILQPKIYFPGGGTTRGFQELQQRPSSPIPQVFDLLPCEEMAINFVVPEVSLPPLFSHSCCIHVHSQFLLLNTPFSFCSLFYPKKLLGFGR
jgi:hypothetical protein